MNKFNLYFLFALILSLSISCENDALEPVTENFIGFEPKAQLFEIEGDATTTIDILVATSDVSSQDRTFELEVVDDISIATVPETVTVPANQNTGTFTITFDDDDTFGFNVQTLQVDFAPAANLNTGTPLELRIKERCDDIQIDFIITTDDWPEETTWELYAGTPPAPANLLQSGGPLDPSLESVAVNSPLCLVPGVYSMVIYDEFGDGIVDGGYEVLNGSDLLANGTVTGDFALFSFTVD